MKARAAGHRGQLGNLPFDIGGYFSLSLLHKAGL
jgi:hypothetical protein